MAKNSVEISPAVWLGDSHDEKQPKERTRGRKGRHSLPRNSLDSNSSNEPIVSTSCQLTKMYSPLKIYDGMGVDDMELYRRLLQYVLSREELKTHGFPIECPDVPGKASFHSCFTSQETDKPKEHNSRTCCRCGAKFFIGDDGQCIVDRGCTYHWGKRVGGIDEHVYFSCCGQDYKSEGCTWNKVHVSAEFFNDDKNFAKTRPKKNVGRNGSFGIYALDCEMCYTARGLEVTKVTIVGPNGLAVYDTFVVPENPIIDYNTHYSGITSNDLKNVKTNLADVQAFIQRLFNSKTILIGHALSNDLRALRVIHETVIDTSVVFPHRYGLPFKRSLKSLTCSLLHRTIQEGKNGHDSVEDARACMELILWKLQSDQKVLQSRLSCSSVSPGSSPQNRLSPKPFTNRHWEHSPVVIVPQIQYLRPTVGASYTYGYWVPPVGSQMELY